MGLRSDHTAGRSWGRKGKTPVVLITGKRFSCNMISVITNHGHLYFMVFKESFTTDVFISFLNRLIRQSNENVFLIIDNHPVHRSKKVNIWLEEHSTHLKLFYLPGYSPELNLDKLLNQDFKSNAVGRKRVHNQKELVSNVRGFLRSRQRRPPTVKNYFNGKHVHYAFV